MFWNCNRYAHIWEAGDSMGDSVFERHNKENQVLSIFHGESQIDS